MLISDQMTKIIDLKTALLLSVVVLSACGGGQKQSDNMGRAEQAVVNMQLGVRYMNMGMMAEAKQNLEMALDQDSRNPQVHNAYAAFNEKIERTELALEHYQKALSLSAEDARINNNYGHFLCDVGEYEQGIALLQRATELPLNARKWFAFTNIGLCYFKQGEFVKAEQMFREALFHNQRYAPALEKMQVISYQKGRYMSSRAFLERYLQVAKHTPETLWIAVQTEQALGNKTLSQQYQQQLMTQFPTSKQANKIYRAIKK